ILRLSPRWRLPPPASYIDAEQSVQGIARARPDTGPAVEGGAPATGRGVDRTGEDVAADSVLHIGRVEGRAYGQCGDGKPNRADAAAIVVAAVAGIDH